MKTAKQLQETLYGTFVHDLLQKMTEYLCSEHSHSNDIK